MADLTQIEILADEIGSLRDELAALKKTIADSRGRVKLSMREQVRCPDCGARRIARFDEIPDFAYGGAQAMGLAVEDRGTWRSKLPRAELEAYVCTECGLTELRLRDTGVFADDKLADAYTILESDDPTAGPYR